MMVTPLRRRESFSVWFGDLLFCRSIFGYKFTLDWEIKVFKLLCPYLLNAIVLRHFWGVTQDHLQITSTLNMF